MSAADTLRDMLCDQPPGPKTFEGLSGFLTALAVCPTEIPTETFMAEIWAGEPPPYLNVREALTGEKCIHACRQEIAAGLVRAREANDPARAVDFEVDADSNDIGFASDWCQGFLRALDLWPEASREAGERADLRDYFDLLRAVAADGEPEGGDIPVATAEVPAAVGAAVLALREALRPPPDVVSPGGR